MTPRELRFEVPEAKSTVSALLLLPRNARLVYVFGHGAGAGGRVWSAPSPHGLTRIRAHTAFVHVPSRRRYPGQRVRASLW